MMSGISGAYVSRLPTVAMQPVENVSLLLLALPCCDVTRCGVLRCAVQGVMMLATGARPAQARSQLCGAGKMPQERCR